MKNTWVRLVCLMLALMMTLSLFGCNGKQGVESVSSDDVSVESIEPEDTTSEEPLDTEPEEIAPTDDEWGEEEPEEEEAAESIYIDELMVLNDQAPVQKNFLGLNGVYHCYPYMEITDGRTYTEKQATYEINAIKQMGLNMVRSYYGTKYAYDANTGGFNWESADMKAIYRWMQELQKADIEVSLNAGWALTQLLSSNVDGRGVWDFYNGVYVAGDVDQTTKNYAKWMTDSLQQFRAHGCNNVTSLLLFTEPGGFHGVRWGADAPYDGRWDGKSITEIEDPYWQDYLRLTKALDKGLKDAGIRDDYLMVGPNEAHTYESAVDGTQYLPMFYNALTQANDYLDVFSHHNYITIPDMTSDVVAENVQLYWKERVDLTKELTGKPFWIDESNVRDNSAWGDTAGVRMENPWEAMQIAVMTAESAEIGVQNLILWSLATQNWNNNTTNSDAFLNGVQRTGAIPSPYLTYTPYPAYYGLSLLTKYFGRGDVYMIEDALVHATCEKSKDGEWTILAINMDFEETTFRLDFAEEIGKQTFYRYLYDTAQQVGTSDVAPIGADLGIKTDDGHFHDTLPGGSFAVYTTRKPE